MSPFDALRRLRIFTLRCVISGLSLLTLILSVVIPNKMIALIVVVSCVLIAVFLFYVNLDRLTNLAPGDSSLQSFKFITIFNTLLVLFGVLIVVLSETGSLVLTERGEKWFAGGAISLVMLVLGNIAPKIPFNRHTGLRLPWTVTNELAWIVAHRLLRYLSLPLAVIYFSGILAGVDFRLLSIAVFFFWIGIPGDFFAAGRPASVAEYCRIARNCARKKTVLYAESAAL